MKSAPNQRVLGLLAVAIAGLSLSLPAQTNAPLTAEKKAAVEKKSAAVETKNPGATKPRPIPFHGNISAVDQAARTITVGKRIFHLTPETKLARNDKTTPATFAAAVVGEPVTGSYVKADDGKLTARSLYFGEKLDTKPAVPRKTPAPTAAKPGN